MKVEIICPLYNAEKYLNNLYKSIKKQKDVKVSKISFVNTIGNDKTEKVLKRLKSKDRKVSYKNIEKKDFSHSLTREEVALKSKADIVCFITQDVKIKSSVWLKNLITPITSGEAEATYSRQVTKYNNIEKYTREKNYPDKSILKSKNDLEKMGLNTFFFSDVSSAILKETFLKLNGYDSKTLPINEDMYIAYKLIMNNYKIKYCADSVVYHSHKFTLKQIYDRYKLTGQFFKENSYLDEYGTTGSGAALAKYILKRIIQEKRLLLLFRYPFDMAVRLFGMKAGKRK